MHGASTESNDVGEVARRSLCTQKSATVKKVRCARGGAAKWRGDRCLLQSHRRPMTCAMVVRYESSASADIAARDRGPISCTCRNDSAKLDPESVLRAVGTLRSSSHWSGTSCDLARLHAAVDDSSGAEIRDSCLYRDRLWMLP